MKNIHVFFVTVISLITGPIVMANETPDSESLTQKWMIFWGGGDRFGDYGVSVKSDGNARLTLLSTSNKEDADGAGITEASDAQYDRKSSETIWQALCSSSSQSGRGLTVTPTDPPIIFQAACKIDDSFEVKRGYIALLPKNLYEQLVASSTIIRNDILRLGRKKIWVNASVVALKREGAHFLVTVRFINSGREAFSFKRPDLWSGRDWDETLAIGATNANDPSKEGGWRFELAGCELANKADFIGKYITLESGAHKDFIFRAMPADSYKAGVYAFALSAWMYMDWKDGKEEHRSHVDFYSGNKNRAVITIDRDYPSTPKEREEWEATHRASMLLQPVRPGETFAEDGLYRAVRLVSGSSYRSLQLKPFKAGDIATTEDVRLHMESATGTELNGPVQWVWEGSAPQPVELHSSEYVEGTEHICKPGVPCPRSGRWIERTLTDTWNGRYTYRLSSIVTRERGKSMPSVTGQQDGGAIEWEWVGA